jgi:cell division control protein 7
LGGNEWRRLQRCIVSYPILLYYNIKPFAGRTFTTNIPSITQDGISWRSFVERQNPDLETDARFSSVVEPQPEDHSSAPPPPSSSSSPSPPSSTTEHHLSAAFDLLDNLLQPESHRRYTPRQALYHPFLAEVDEDGEEGLGDDEWFPHPYGSGICGERHFRDDVTEEPWVRIRVRDEDGMDVGRDEVRKLDSGEGIAIGSWPCEFHKEEYGF